MKRHLAFLLAGGAIGIWLKAPFSTLSALSSDDHSQVLQFITEIGPVLGREPEPAFSFDKAIENLVNASKSAAFINDHCRNS